jgi:hypothetical protein
MLLPPEYLQGIELFNRGQYFECHEVLEKLWQSAPEPERTFLHALIQVAAALHHRQRGNHAGARSVYRRAREKLGSLPPQVMQLDVAALLAQTDAVFTSEDTAENPPFNKVQIRLAECS